jgi:hypothetical protein
MTISSDLFVKWTVGLGLAEADLDFLQWAIEDRTIQAWKNGIKGIWTSGVRSWIR